LSTKRVDSSSIASPAPEEVTVEAPAEVVAEAEAAPAVEEEVPAEAAV
jgi:hypothetical protein